MEGKCVKSKRGKPWQLMYIYIYFFFVAFSAAFVTTQ